MEWIEVNRKKMKNRTSMWPWLLFAVVIIGSMVGLFGIYCFGHAGPRLFRRYVLDPVPRSVTEVRVDRLGGVFAYGYAFRFRIQEADVATIIKSRPFQRVQNVRYEDWGELNFEWSPTFGRGLSLYPSETSMPAWFTPGLWHDPESYAYEQCTAHRRTWVLLYNRQAGEAYFVFTTEH
jgi:hypothetical protein